VSRLEIRGVRKSFDGTPVLTGIDLSVPTGGIAAVLGPSGCGKTTLLRVVAGFERPDQGTVALDDQVVAGPGSHLPPERRGVGIVPQEGALFPHLDVAANVGFGLRRRDPGRAARVAQVLELVGLPGFDHRRPAELSGGQQQRVALARALAPQPRIILLDEPFSALDAGLRASVRHEVRQALAAAGVTALLVTHDQEEALSMADLVAVMAGGVVRQVGPPEAVYRDPVDLSVALTVGEAVTMPAEAAQGWALTGAGRLALRGQDRDARGAGTVLLRPEQIRLVAGGTPGTAQGRLLAVRFHGHDSTVDVALANGADGAQQVLTCRTQEAVPTGPLVGVRVVGDVAFFARRTERNCARLPGGG